MKKKKWLWNVFSFILSKKICILHIIYSWLVLWRQVKIVHVRGFTIIIIHELQILLRTAVLHHFLAIINPSKEFHLLHLLKFSQLEISFWYGSNNWSDAVASGEIALHLCSWSHRCWCYTPIWEIHERIWELQAQSLAGLLHWNHIFLTSGFRTFTFWISV